MKVGSPNDLIKGEYKREYKPLNLKPVIYVLMFLSVITVMCVIGALVSSVMYEDKPFKSYQGPEGGYYLTEDNINHINGDHIKISLNTDTLYVSGHHNEIIINNDNVTLITVTGLENTVYYSVNACPEIIIEGMENKVIKLDW